jgi:hypothetical protein
MATTPSLFTGKRLARGAAGFTKVLRFPLPEWPA